ncbi:helix-turn-helix domain-containing protein [Streptomyces formicae]
MRLQKLSQHKLAKRARVSQPYISLLLRGKRGATPETAWRIATALGVFSDELFADKPTVHQGPPLSHQGPPPLRLVGAPPRARQASMRAQAPVRRHMLATAA